MLLRILFCLLLPPVFRCLLLLLPSAFCCCLLLPSAFCCSVLLLLSIAFCCFLLFAYSAEALTPNPRPNSLYFSLL